MSIGNGGNNPLSPITSRQLEEWTNNSIVYYQDPDNPVVNDWRMRDSGAFLYDERYNGATWDIVSTIGASIVIDRFIVNTLSGGLFLDNPDTNERLNLIKPSTTDNGVAVGDTRNNLFLLSETLEDFKLRYNGVDCESDIETGYAETLGIGEYTKIFNCTSDLDITMLYATLKVNIASKISISITDSVNGRVSYLTMSEAEYTESGGIAIKDKDTGLTTGEININLFSIGSLIAGRTYSVVLKVSEGSFLGSTTFPFLQLEGKKQLNSIIAGRDWVKEQTIFGTEFEKFESLAESTAGYTWTNKIDATTAEKPAGTYRIGYNCEITETDNSQEVRILVNDSVIHNHTTGNDELEPNVEEDNWTSIAGFTYLTLTSASTIDISIQHKDSGTGKMSNAIIEIWRVS